MSNHDEAVLAFLEHHGVKGQKWGIRHDPTKGFRAEGFSPVVDASINSSTKTAAKQVSSLIGQRYGFRISAVKDLKTNNPTEFERGTVAFVQHTPGQHEGVIFVKPGAIEKDLKDAEKSKWFAQGTGNTRALLTHETAHAMFHAEQKTKVGLFRAKTVGGNIEARDAALRAADTQARKDGVSDNELLSKVSGYAAASGTREEAEAEMFSQYHWNPNPPAFVKVWGETLHQQLGIDPTPFRKVVK